MPVLEFREPKELEEAESAISILKTVLKGQTVAGYLNSIAVRYPQQQQQNQQGHEYSPEELKKREEEYYKHVAQLPIIQKQERDDQIKFANLAVVELETKSPEFSLPAYRALEEFKKCVSSKDYGSFLCLIAFLVTLASIVMPLANAPGKEK
jgi:hypothetical protein